MTATAILTAVPCSDCGAEDGHLNTGNVRPARLSGIRFGFPPGQLLCKTCYEKHRYRCVIRPRVLESRASNRNGTT